MELLRLAIGGRTALVREKWQRPVTAALLENRGCVRQDRGGRGEVLRFPFDKGWGIIRPYRRGGLVRHGVRRSYLLTNRPLREFLILVHLYERGLSVPEPLGVCWERHGLLFQGALATREVQAATLRDFLIPAPQAPEETLRRVGKLIREMHQLGAYHKDLQVENILIGDPWLYLIDFDRAVLHARASRLRCLCNLLRLRRSFQKNFVPLRYFKLICEGYGVDTIPTWLKVAYGTKGKASDVLSGRTDSHGQPIDR